MTDLVSAIPKPATTSTASTPAAAFEHTVTDKTTPPAQDATYVATAAPPPPADPGEEVMKAVAKQIESYLKANGRDLQFSVDSETGQTVITVRDSSTGEVIRQIPNAEALRISQALGQQPNALIDVLI